MIFVSSINSCNSIWCKYELNYFRELGKPIYFISKKSIIKKNFSVNKMKDFWFVDLNYKNLELVKGAKLI